MPDIDSTTDITHIFHTTGAPGVPERPVAYWALGRAAKRSWSCPLAASRTGFTVPDPALPVGRRRPGRPAASAQRRGGRRDCGCRRAATRNELAAPRPAQAPGAQYSAPAGSGA